MSLLTLAAAHADAASSFPSWLTATLAVGGVLIAVIIALRYSRTGAQEKVSGAQAEALDAMQKTIETLRGNIEDQAKKFKEEIDKVTTTYEVKLAALVEKIHALENRAVKAESEVEVLRSFTQPELSKQLFSTLEAQHQETMSVLGSLSAGAPEAHTSAD